MNCKKRIIQVILAAVILAIPTYGCGMRSTIQLQVVDAETKQPIESAVALIYWLKPETFLFMRYPGRKGVELKETFSDKNGHFIIPRYSNKDYEYYLTIYKKGYVCWSNREVFPTQEKRTNIALKNGMMIEMERFNDSYDKLDHAGFVQSYSAFRKAPSLFDSAIEEEILLLVKRAQQQKKEWEEQKGKR